jgi:hypothetical protein
MTNSDMPPGPAQQHIAFTVRYSGRSSRLTSEIEIFPAFAPDQPSSIGKKFIALYDTGATNSAVSPQVVTDLNLPVIRAANAAVGGGTIPTTMHLVNIALPNKVMFPMVTVSKMVLLGFDAIIGMDILGNGDFSVTHYKGSTTFSFCLPSLKEIDFVGELNRLQASQQPRVGRNDPCPCNSGKKFKKCHGA